MDLPTQTHLTTLRHLLSFRRGELRADIRADQLAGHGSAEAAAHEVLDRKDEAAQQQLADVSTAREQHELDELALVEAALHRLDTATYGDCVQCGKPIALQRLLVQPAAQRCAPCQAELEREHEHALRRPR